MATSPLEPSEVVGELGHNSPNLEQDSFPFPFLPPHIGRS
jgi:hypothetical protein